MKYARSMSPSFFLGLLVIVREQIDRLSYLEASLGVWCVGDNKYRSQDGKWWYRAKSNDLEGHRPDDTPHVHLERLDPTTGL